jgi:uncharacterized protein YcaQ
MAGTANAMANSVVHNSISFLMVHLPMLKAADDLAWERRRANERIKQVRICDLPQDKRSHGLRVTCTLQGRP